MATDRFQHSKLHWAKGCTVAVLIFIVQYEEEILFMEGHEKNLMWQFFV